MTADVTNVLLHGSIASIGALLKAKGLSAVELASFFVARIERFDRAGTALNAVRCLNDAWRSEAIACDRERAAGIDRGPLHGIPFLIKDNITTAGVMPTTAGASALGGFRATRDATLLRNLRAAGAILLGKTNLTEFADFVSDDMPSEWSGAGGIVRNPHGIPYGRGQGSSVGSAAAVAAGLCVFAIGSETQNSIQTPACFSSVVGLKPTVGRVSRHGLVPLVPNQDSPGPLARSVADASTVFAALQSFDPADGLSLLVERDRAGPAIERGLHGLRLGVLRRVQPLPAACVGADILFEAVLATLSRRGAEITDPCDLPRADELNDVRSCVFRAEFHAALDVFLESHGAPCGMANLADIIRWNGAHPDTIPYGQNLLVAAEATRLDARYRADRARDVLLSRTEGIHAALERSGVDALIAPMGTGAKASGKAGTPVVAIPAGALPDGTPFGVTLLGALGDDAHLLALAAAVEATVDGRRFPEMADHAAI